MFFDALFTHIHTHTYNHKALPYWWKISCVNDCVTFSPHLFPDLTLVQWIETKGKMCVCVVTKCSTKINPLTIFFILVSVFAINGKYSANKNFKSLLFAYMVKMPLDWWWLRTIFTYPMGIIFRYHLFCIKFI